MPPKSRKRNQNAVSKSLEPELVTSFDDIMTAKECGDYERFTSMLKAALGSTDQDLRAQACYELALLNCQQNNHEEADFFLRKLGYRYKLSRNIWQCSNQSTTYSAGLPGVVHCIDDIMPMEFLHKLQEVFSPASPFWTEHGYPADSFFSYNVPLPLQSNSSSSKKKKKASDTNLMTQLAEYLKPIVMANFPDVAVGKTTSIEWWAHSRCNGASAGHRLHYDLDEVSLEDHGELTEHIHPFVSSVLYLDDGGSSGAPTLVTNQSVLQNVCSSDIDDDDDDEYHDSNSEGSVRSDHSDEMAWLCPPKQNRLLLFEGSLMHGVVPHIRDQSQSSTGGAPRVTLMIGWWGSHVATTDPPVECCQECPGDQPTLIPLMPNMGMPKCSEVSTVTVRSKNRRKMRSVKLSWPSLFKTDVSLEKFLCLHNTSSPSPCAGLYQVEGSIWEEVSEEREDVDSPQEVIKSDMQFLGNWFVSSRTEILDQIEYSIEMGRRTGLEKGKASCLSSNMTEPDNEASAVGWMSAEELKRLRGE